MSPIHSITVAQLSRLVGLAGLPVVIDIRIADDVAADPRLVPASVRRDWQDVAGWAAGYRGRSVVVVCQRGHKLSDGAAAWLRHEGVRAEKLEGGFEAWRDAALRLLRPEAVPVRQGAGRTVWVTRARPKVDRIACPWLIRRLVDPAAIFLFVSPGQVADVGSRFGATPFDIEEVIWSHRDAGEPQDLCTFDVMLAEFGLRTAPPERLAASLGLSRMDRDDLAQLEAGLALDDAFYRWSRDAVGETHTWQAAAVAS